MRLTANINRLVPAKHWDHTRGRLCYLLLACANHSSMIYVNQLDELVDEMGNTGNNTGRWHGLPRLSSYSDCWTWSLKTSSVQRQSGQSLSYRHRGVPVLWPLAAESEAHLLLYRPRVQVRSPGYSIYDQLITVWLLLLISAIDREPNAIFCVRIWSKLKYSYYFLYWNAKSQGVSVLRLGYSRITLYNSGGSRNRWKGAAPEMWALPPNMESGGCAPSGGAGGRAPAGGSGPSGGEAPQKLKPKDTLEASHKALWWCKRQMHRWQLTLNFCTIFVFTACLRQSAFCSVSHTDY